MIKSNRGPKGGSNPIILAFSSGEDTKIRRIQAPRKDHLKTLIIYLAEVVSPRCLHHNITLFLLCTQWGNISTTLNLFLTVVKYGQNPLPLLWKQFCEMMFSFCWWTRAASTLHLPWAGQGSCLCAQISHTHTPLPPNPRRVQSQQVSSEALSSSPFPMSCSSPFQIPSPLTPLLVFLVKEMLRHNSHHLIQSSTVQSLPYSPQ